MVQLSEHLLPTFSQEEKLMTFNARSGVAHGDAGN